MLPESVAAPRAANAPLLSGHTASSCDCALRAAPTTEHDWTYDESDLLASIELPEDLFHSDITRLAWGDLFHWGEPSTDHV